MTKEEFIKAYCENSGITRNKFDRFEVALPCDCGDSTCAGWAAVSNNERSIKSHVDLYGGEEEPTAK